jgi:hypothetical protein
MDKRVPINIPDFLNIQILESFVEKTKNNVIDTYNLPPSIPLYYSINTNTESLGYEIFKNTYTETINNAISFYKKIHTEYIMYHSVKYGLWIIILKDNALISAYPKMSPTIELNAY